MPIQLPLLQNTSKSFRKFATGQFTNIWCHIHQPCCINLKTCATFYTYYSYFWEHEKQKYKNEFLLEFHGGRKVSTIHEFSSDDLIDVRDPPFSSHIVWIKSKIINLIDWLIDWCCYLCLSHLRYTILLLQAMYQV